jgi:hypothetical protein
VKRAALDAMYELGVQAAAPHSGAIAALLEDADLVIKVRSEAERILGWINAST